MLNLGRVKQLEAWLKTTNVTLAQVNGQRKYGGPPEAWDGPPPGSRCEVFISQIPRDVYEDQLIPLFSSAGLLWEFRLMMNFSGQNRGFAYAKYGTPAAATGAIRLLDGHTVEPGQRLSVRRSTEKRHLCVEELPPTTGQQDLQQVLRVLTEGVERVSLKAGPGIEGVSAIVAFSSHYAASMARKVLAEAFKKQFNLTVSVKWHPVQKPGGQGPPPPQKPPKGLLPPPSSAPHSPLPPPPGFCRAVGGLAAAPSPPGRSVSAPSPAPTGTHLDQVLEGSGSGRLYSHTGPDGFLYLSYRMLIPGTRTPFEGVVTILPGASGGTVLDEAHQAAARQILLRLQGNRSLM
ncbi:LOW QUALITY PROTEIN: dead end protein 1 [Brachionichthys hirsutus]|uniref:LOW QUALITY PROTEIN: dead end protein 1 n=1 Tax=Brachionichthys hirsutus TaxID=412623 RepID=UPI003604C0BF